MKIIYKLKILFLRIVGYEKPLRVAFLKYLQVKYKTFKPHYETVLLESCKEAKKLGINKISVLELGVAGGNGIIALEKYKKSIEKHLDVKIDIYGFDTGEGMPPTNLKEDLPFVWKQGIYKVDKEALSKKIKSKIFYGDIKNTVGDFINTSPNKVACIFFDLDYYSSTKSFMDQIDSLREHLLPRVFCYFDDLHLPEKYISDINGVALAIKEFNSSNVKFKFGKNVDHIMDFKFPLAKSLIYMLHHFDHHDYNKFIGEAYGDDLDIKSTKIKYSILDD
ncbi:hypothetical protein ABXT63_04135 [Candidatus Pelagibacter sp. Uisw_092]|jgi:hypothetical protein|uniref:hypothetical protein n=1 Tax=Candidatus Pelagibacter sp. Uisw_092 TaxID=3230979 RepID=UPI0039EBC73E